MSELGETDLPGVSELAPLPTGTPRGWVAREPTPADAPAAFDLLVACDLAVLGVPDVALGDVEADLSIEPHRQAVVVDGRRVVAWVWLLDKAAGRTLADVYVDPELADELGDRLADWAWSRARHQAAKLATQRAVDRTSLEVGSLDGDSRTARRLRANGFEPVRTFWRMARPLQADDSRAVVARGVQVRVVREQETRLVHELLETAFDDHWGHRRRSYPEWWQQVSTDFGFDLSLCWLAELEGEPAGALLGSSRMADEGAIYIATLGTLPFARGRGVAKSLLRQAFAAGYDRGWTRAKLNVDTQNVTSALDLYEGVGLRVDFAMHAWRQEVGAG